jgi:hypothetical protein
MRRDLTASTAAFHPNTLRVLQDWEAKRGDRVAPARADISPADHREILPQLFILGRDQTGAAPFRLSGGLLADLHACDLRGVCFSSMWAGSDQRAVRDALAETRRTGAPIIVSASAWTAHSDEARLEILLAPMTGPDGEMDRVLGLYQPTSTLRRLLGQPVVALTLIEIRNAAGAAAPLRPRGHLRLVALEGRRLD